MLPFERISSRRLSSASPRQSYMSSDSWLRPRSFTWLCCAGNPGSRNRIVSRPGRRWPRSMKRVKVPCIDPTVGTMHRGGMSMSRNALRNRLPFSFRAGMPAMLGYWEAMPSRRAARSASIPTCDAGRPGFPISRCTNGSPRWRSRRLASARICRMVAEAMFGMFIACISLCSRSCEIGCMVFFILET